MHSGGTASAPTSPASSNASKPSAPAVARTSLTAAEQQQQAKLKREQMSDAFHGRLAGIKHNVDALNNRLTSFEDKVNKEDAHLNKGDPEEFDIDLD
jgi:archaellum component FlaC